MTVRTDDEPGDASERRRFDRRLWSRVASWLLVAVLLMTLANFWQMTTVNRRLTELRLRSEARQSEFAAFRQNVTALATNADAIHLRSLAEIEAIRADVTVLQEKLHKVDVATEPRSQKAKAKAKK